MWKLYPVQACLLIPFFVVFLVFSNAKAQNATFFENFDSTAIGELPEGWTYYQTGGNNPGSHWITSTKDMFGSKVAWSNWGDEALENDIDEDWLITPQITPATGDFLIFDASQVFVFFDYGSKYHILISTASADPEDFTDTLASYTETEFPGYTETLALDLEAYHNKPIYIAFVHENNSMNRDEVDDWYLDNVWVRAQQPAGFYSGEIFHQADQVLPLKNAATGVIIGVKLTIIGDYDLANISSMTFSKTGTIDPSQITSASLYSTGQESFIGTNDDENDIQAELFGRVLNPKETFEIKGNMDLPVGDNYFWLFYTINPNYSPKFPYQNADASFDKVKINGAQNNITIPEKIGARPIVESWPVNDSIKNAIELSPNGGRYGSYNERAKPEPAYEKLAYCAPQGYYDVANSIWWHFKAPSDGYITADLSETDFNTVLLILDKNFDQFACNDNISDDELQSEIIEYEVKAGQEMYIRVTGAGAPNDPNGPAGVVIMDFAFTSGPLGMDDLVKKGISLSAPYPNPSHGNTYVDFELKEPSKVSFEVNDILGKSVWRTEETIYAPGIKHKVSIGASALLPGTYILRVKGTAFEASRKLIIAR